MCRACPRLVEWREEVAVVKRKSFADQPYWGRPIPGWGSARPRVVIVGLAPAAHGGNRTGRVFTGDRSGDFLFAALHRAGLANQAACVDAADGLALNDTRVAAAVRCAPPGNAPTPAERATCAPWLDAEWRLIGSEVRVIVALGAFAWRAALQMIRSAGGTVADAGTAVRARCDGDARRRDADRLLPPQPAEHVHRQAHPADARRHLPAGPGTFAKMIALTSNASFCSRPCPGAHRPVDVRCAGGDDAPRADGRSARLHPLLAGRAPQHARGGGHQPAGGDRASGGADAHSSGWVRAG